MVAVLTLVLSACAPPEEHVPQSATMAGALEAPSLLASAPAWKVLAPMSTARTGHTATLLPNGKLLVVGGETNSGYIPSAELYDPATGTWTATGSLAQARNLHTATLLPTGKVLVAGGTNTSGRTPTAELYDPVTGTWTATGSLAQARSLHTATLLPNGKLLVVGGEGNRGRLASAELYDPATSTWTATGSLSLSRLNHTATLLPSGKVLITGGQGDNFLSGAEVYDPAAGNWTPTGPLATARYNHTATLLPSGKVLVTGGQGSTGYLSSTELYDPATGAWSSTGALSLARSLHSTTLLPSGKVLAVGGYGTFALLASAEVYDPATGSWTSTTSMSQAQGRQTATLLPTGKVLVVGGISNSVILAKTEVYDPATGSWAPTASMSQARTSHTATLLSSGKVLVAGGESTSGYLTSAALYDPATGTWASTGPFSTFRSNHTATQLPNGKVLMVGGYNGADGPLSSVQVYTPETGTWSATGSLIQPRISHTATLLPNGRVLVAGGTNNSSMLATAELYNPATGTWTSTGSFIQARYLHTATLLQNGKVLVAGGNSTSGPLSVAQLYDPATGAWTSTGSLAEARYNFTTALLPDGKVLAMGGYGIFANRLSSAELYNPATGTWTSAGSLAQAREGARAILLPSGKVLVTGGYGTSGQLASAEVYDPTTGSWITTGSLAQARSGHTVTVLPNGKVLVTGGYGTSGQQLTSAELYEDTGANPSWLPELTSITPSTSLEVGSLFIVNGLRLRGVSEGSFGNQRSSPTDFPLLTLQDVARGVLYRLPSLDFSGTHVAAKMPPVTAGTYLLSVTVNGLTSSKVLSVIDDQTPPDTLLNSAPATPTNQPTATFTFSANKANASFECSLDNGLFTTCTSPTTYSNLTEAVHTFRVRARDTLGNVDASPASYSWSVDMTPPETTLTSAPASLGNQSTATFTFSSHVGASFRCSLDGATFSPCTSPATYANLTEGTHTFQVRASDVAGNVDASPASHSWTVDLTAPETSLTSTPASLSNQPTATFAFSSETGASFDCSLDGGAFTACTSPSSYANLTEDTHTFRVRARDVAGNVDASPASHTWTVDLTAPETALTSTPANLSNQATATFAFSSEAGASFECSLDGVAFTACTSPSSYANLTEGTHTFRVRASDAAGNVEASPASFSWTVDLTAPETSLTSTPASLSNQSTATFAFSSEAGASFECSLDAEAFSPCASPLTSANLAEGTHTFRVRAADAAGNVDASPASHTWTVDLTAPETSLTSTPASLSNQATATFAFSSGAGASFECSLDGAAFTACTSPIAYTHLAEGTHTFQVRALDMAGNVDASPASHSWTVDLTAPETSLTSTPASLSNQATATFAFSSEASASFECSLDGGAFEACASPLTHAHLAEGTHTFRVRARDAAGNVDDSPASHSWTIDLAMPDTTLTSAPNALTHEASATFTFSSETGASFECSLDGAAFSPCASPATYANLAEGMHTFQVRALDAAGNVDATPASHTWTVDLTVPDTVLTSAPANPSNQTTATFVFSSDDVDAHFECSLDGAAFTACTSPVAYDNLTEGTHSFQVRASDAAGNTDASPASHTWTVDLTALDTLITSAPSNPSNQATATFTFSSETGASFECSLDGAAFTACTSPATYANLTEGTHSFQVRARDAAGNVDDSAASHTSLIDLTAPAAPVITSPANGATLDDDTPTVSGTAQPGSTVTLTLDGTVAGTTTADTAGAWSLTLDSALADGPHTVTATASDTGGTSPASAPVSFTVDTTPGTPSVPVGGCGCAAGPGDASWLLVGLALLAGVVSRRRGLLA
jgi:MYXO-CTERM domain-containing protein